jgi:Mn-dependent transcriptional regulator
MYPTSSSRRNMSSIEGIEDPFGPGTAGGTALLEREETQLSEPGDHERFSHYVRKEKILESALTGEPVRALCGKMWVPGRDPQKFPVCPQCKEIYEGLAPGNDGDNGSGE